MKKLNTTCVKKNENSRRIKMWMAFCRIVVLAFLSSMYVAQATTFDVAADFSTTNNPNGVWSYGWSSTLTSSFNRYPNHGKFDPYPIDVWAGSNFPYSPNVSHNGTGSVVDSHPTIIWQPGQFSLHPGDNGEYSYARWTAPEAGIFDIVAMFTGIDKFGTTTDVHVLHNGTSLPDGVGSVNGFGDTWSFSTTVSVVKDDTIDFAVGYGTNQHHTYDTTALSATITPEPGTVLLLGLGGVALRKRRKG
jgi:hypothetical protein